MLVSPACKIWAVVPFERLVLQFIFLHQYQSGLSRLPSCFVLTPEAAGVSLKSVGLGRAEGPSVRLGCEAVPCAGSPASSALLGMMKSQAELLNLLSCLQGSAGVGFVEEKVCVVFA